MNAASSPQHRTSVTGAAEDFPRLGACAFMFFLRRAFRC